MFQPLPKDFSYQKYGLEVRLVTKEDTEFVLSLRTDSELSKHIHHTDADVEKHLQWFARYKQREAEGRDYYFIYFKNGIPVGLNRIYNIFEYYGTPGSWICSPANSPETTIATYLCARDIYFQQLGLELLVYDVRKENTKVWKLHKMLGAKLIGESDIDYFFSMNKNDFYKKLPFVIKSLNLE